MIAQLAVHERNAIHRAADLVNLSSGDVLLRAHAVADVIFFPIDSVVSVVRRMSNGLSFELALVGSDGLIGLDAFMDVEVQLDEAVVLTPGSAYRIAVADLKNELRRGDALQRQLLRFAGSLSAQTAQTLLCGRLHGPEQRLARWLLMIRDRTPARPLPVGPESMRTALGIDESRTEAAVKRLAAARFIRAGDQTVSILDADGLEATSCECYDSPH